MRSGYQEIRTRVFIRADAPEEKIREFAALVKKRCPVGDCITRGVTISETCFVAHDHK